MKTIAITGVLGYSGRYIAAEAQRRGWRVIGLTDSAGRLPNPADYELRPMPWSTEAEVLAGVDVLVNTYWVRFSYSPGAGGTHAAFSHAEAVQHTEKMFESAVQSRVKRVIHTSITHPDAESELPYFKGKAALEHALKASGLAHSILRPAILFGDTAGESILINNMAWVLRRLPVAATFGWGHYRLQPIHVQDFAELAMDEAENTAPSRTIDAVGRETYTFRELWKLLARHMRLWRPVVPMPHWVGYAAAKVLGLCMGDVMLTREEISGLAQDRLAVNDAGVGVRSFESWVREHAAELGNIYASELARRK